MLGFRCRLLRVVVLGLIAISGSVALGVTGADAVAAQGATPSGSSNCVTVVEPNDQPPQATDLGTDVGCATSPNANGGQDVFKWTVDDAGAAKRWTISTSAIPGQAVKLEIYTVTVDTNGVVTNPVKLTGVSGDSGQAASIENVLVAKGTYFIATAIGGGGAYELTVSPGDSVPAANDTGDHASPETALPLQDAFALSGDRASGVDGFAWTLDDRAAATHWTL
ncbi:MAG TPA: hypothetical protein VFQ54_06470, partial [Thermomicrobiales bacterium]|nr:hypothetical protein [Thermomicrobiales bacterium]